MPQFGWILDLKRCVGCHACAVACKAENNTSPEQSPLVVRYGRAVAVNYRFVLDVEGGAYPAPTRAFITMGCNHCESPACLASCPVAAITKDADTGLVLIDQAACIGCRYCEWACPYGAPQFNATTGLVEKCTGCYHRAAKGLPPACATTCSGRALNYTTEFDAGGGNGSPPEGFADASLTHPSIRFL
jgi:Fe-S-cluster-containing dehydrogenase component